MNGGVGSVGLSQNDIPTVTSTNRDMHGGEAVHHFIGDGLFFHIQNQKISLSMMH